MICMIFMVPTNWFDNVNGLYVAFLHFNQGTLEINIYELNYGHIEREEPVTIATSGRRRRPPSMKSTIINKS